MSAVPTQRVPLECGPGTLRREPAPVTLAVAVVLGYLALPPASSHYVIMIAGGYRGVYKADLARYHKLRQRTNPGDSWTGPSSRYSGESIQSSQARGSSVIRDRCLRW
jgi:hypothetical protein